MSRRWRKSVPNMGLANEEIELNPLKEVQLKLFGVGC